MNGSKQVVNGSEWVAKCSKLVGNASKWIANGWQIGCEWQETGSKWVVNAHSLPFTTRVPHNTITDALHHKFLSRPVAMQQGLANAIMRFEKVARHKTDFQLHSNQEGQVWAGQRGDFPPSGGMAIPYLCGRGSLPGEVSASASCANRCQLQMR